MSARQGVMPKWVERAITRMEEWRKSPLVFVQPSWEESYRRWHFSKLSQWRVWMHIVLFSGLIGLLSNFIELLQISERSHNVSALCRGAVSSIVSIVYFFSMEIMLRAISISAKTQGAWDVQPHLHKSVCLLSIAIACELWLVMESEAKTVELALRWVATCPLAFATFEANGAWFHLVLGFRPIFVALYTGRLADSKADIFLAVLAVLGIISMFFVFRARRAEWIRALATTSVFNSSYIPPTQNDKSGGTKMHDDYFTEEEWSGLVAEVEEEGAEMLKRSAYGHGVRRHQGLVPYEWMHGEAVLGHGTYGKVVVVKSSVTDEICALKRIRARSSGKAKDTASARDTGESEETREDEKREQEKRQTEGMLLQMLRHPNVVGFVDELELEGETQLVMELCVGGSLATLIRNFGPLGEQPSKWLTLNIVCALKYLHQHGISHMDLKPENCLLTPSPAGDVVLKLCDFGGSGFKQGPQGRVCGTPAYVAPELFTNRKVISRRKMDIWSLGVCTVEMLTGKHLKLDLPADVLNRAESEASAAATARETAAQSVNDHIRALRALRADPPLPFKSTSVPHAQFVRDCLRLDPRQRPTAHALARHAFLAGTERCPREHKAMATVLEQPPVEWEDIAPVSTYRKLWPRMRRKARSLLSLAGLWQALVDLDQPFHSFALETQFRQVSTESSLAIAHTLWRALLPPLHLYTIASDNNGIRTAPHKTPTTVFLIAMGQLIIWSPRARLFRHRETWIYLFRAMLVISTMLRPLSIVAAPARYAALSATATLMPLVGEGLVYLVLMTLSQTTQAVLRELNENAASKEPRSLPALCDHLSSIISVHIASSVIACTTLLWRRRCERDRFRNECMEREMVAAELGEESSFASKSQSNRPSPENTCKED